MEKRICTEAKNGNGYDIAIIEGKKYVLYCSYGDCNIDVDGNYSSSFHLNRKSFDEALKGLKMRKKYNLEGYDPERWERYYTTSLINENLVDQIEIDEKSKIYRLFKNEDDFITDGYDEYGFEQFAHYVSRFVFDLIVEGLEKRALNGALLQWNGEKEGEK